MNEELTLFRGMVRRFLDAELVPNLDVWREERGIPRAFFSSAGAQGLLCPSLPEKFGGAGGDFRFNAVVVEEVAKSGITPVAFAVHSDVVCNYILHWGSEAQRERYLPKMARGEWIGAIAMTEPGAGSDLQAIETSARRRDGNFVIRGAKTFISNGQMCDFVIVAAKTCAEAGARGVSLFLVDAALPGFTRGRKLKKMGGHEQDTSELFFDDVKVPLDAMLGEEGRGFAILMQELPTERLSLSIAAVAAAEKALEITIAYAKARRAFGKALIEQQDTAFRLAELRAHVNAAKPFVSDCLARHLEGRLSAVDGAEAKLVTTKLQCRVVDECLQVHGGYGWMDEFLISRLYADARVQRIYGGADEIMKLVISRAL